MASIEDTLRKYLQKAVDGDSAAGVAREAGVPQPVVYNFIKGKRGLTLASVDKLCKVLGLELRRKGKR